MDNVTGLIVTAIVAVVGIIKFKLIEELVKKITPDDGKARGYAVLLLFFTVVGLAAISLSLGEPVPTNLETESVETEVEPVTPKSDLEVKVDAAKEVVELAEKVASTVVENKRIKDSTFLAGRQEKWVYRIGYWTKEDDDIIAMHNQLSEKQNIKLIKQKRKYIFIKDDSKSKDELEKSLSDLKNELNGLPIEIIDINTFLTRKKDDFLYESKTFGRRKKKITLECLIAD
jgi:hypothetical protein